MRTLCSYEGTVPGWVHGNEPVLVWRCQDHVPDELKETLLRGVPLLAGNQRSYSCVLFIDVLLQGGDVPCHFNMGTWEHLFNRREPNLGRGHVELVMLRSLLAPFLLSVNFPTPLARKLHVILIVLRRIVDGDAPMRCAGCGV